MAYKKWRFEFFAVYDVEGMARHYEKMAAKGWLIDGIYGVFHRYKKIQPQQMKFTVVYMNKLSDYAQPSDAHREFYEMCSDAGWQTVVREDSMQIFASSSENPVPIETDPVVQTNNLHISKGKKFLVLSVVAVVLWLFNIKLRADLFYRAPGIFFTGGSYTTMKIQLGIVAVLAVPAVDYILWYLKARKIAAEDQRFYNKKTGIVVPLLSYSMTAASLLIFLQMYNILLLFMSFMSVGIMLTVTSIMKKTMGSDDGVAGENEAISILINTGVLILWIMGSFYGLEHLGIPVEAKAATAVRTEIWTSLPDHSYKKYIYADDIPLKLEDFTDVNYNGYSYEGQTFADNPLIGFYSASQSANGKDKQQQLYYDVFVTESAHLYDSIVESHLKMYGSKPVDDTGWTADKVYKRKNDNVWLLCYPGRIIFLNSGGELDGEDMAEIEQKLTCFDIADG